MSWGLYCRVWPHSKRRKCVQVYASEGEAAVGLCQAALMFPGKDWKVRKMKTEVNTPKPHDEKED